MNPAQAVRLGLAAAALTAVALTAVAYALYTLLPVGYDFYHWYWPIPRAWLAGETHLYDPASRGFYLLPWAVWILLPFASMDLRWGMASLTLTSLLIIGGVSYVYSGKAGAKRRGLIALLATVCPYSLTVLFVGTLDAWSLLGAYLGYWALQARRPWLLGVALLLLAVRPQNAVLTAPMLVLAMRRWPRQRLAEVALAPAAVMVASFVSFGWDWPLRWWQNVLTQPPLPYLVTSTYAATNLGGVPLPLVVAGSLVLVGLVTRRVWQEGLTRETLNLAVVANAVVSPYMLSQSYVLLLALPWTYLAVRRPWLAAVPYAVSLVMLIRAQGLWDRLGLLDVTFPLILLVFLLLELRLPDGRR